MDNDAFLVKSDKTNTPVVIYRQDYNEKIYDYIKTNNYPEIKDPTNKYFKIVKDLITKFKNTFNYNNNIKYHTRLYPYCPSAPILTGLPKLHKPGYPIRPLINFKTAPSYFIAKTIDKILRQKIDINNKYIVKNGYEVIFKLKNTSINNNTKMISYDITNMYSNIPINATIDIIRNKLINNNEQNNTINNIITIIRNICDQNYFQFDNKFYKQNDGLPMGSPVSAIMSEIYIQDFEEKIVFGIENTHNIILWIRYVDDILVFYNPVTKNEHEIILNKLHTFNDKLKFTFEQEYNRTINFLDVNIQLINDKIITNVYRKNYNNCTTININSHHPWIQKTNTYYNMINRAFIYTQYNKNNMNKEIKQIKEIARYNGYSNRFIDRLYKKYIEKRRNTVKNTPNTSNVDVNSTQSIKYIKYKYNNRVIDNINKVFGNSKYTVSYKPNNLIYKFLNSNKNHSTSIYNKCGIYKIKCDLCNSVYIGRTDRSFSVRYNEHVRAYLYKRPNCSNVAHHLIEHKHTITSMENNMEILEINCDKNQLEHLEKYYIYKFKRKFNLMNLQLDYEGDSLYKIINRV